MEGHTHISSNTTTQVCIILRVAPVFIHRPQQPPLPLLPSNRLCSYLPHQGQQVLIKVHRQHHQTVLVVTAGKRNLPTSVGVAVSVVRKPNTRKWVSIWYPLTRETRYS